MINYSLKEVSMNIGILGTGNGAHVLAADLSLAGHEVYWSRVGDHQSESWEYILNSRKFRLTGLPLVAKESGMVLIRSIFNSLDKLIKATDIIFVVTTADRHASYMAELLRYNLKNKLIIFMPGRFACLRFLKILNDQKRKIDFAFAETACFPYVTRILEPGTVKCIGVKANLPFSIYPKLNQFKSINIIKELFPMFYQSKNILETSVMDHCSIIHPLSALHNVNSNNIDLPCYGFNNQIGKLADKLDFEKMSLQKALNMTAISIPRTLRLYYKVRARTTYSAMAKVRYYQSISSPLNINTRYLNEDVPYGLIPNYLIGTHLGIDMSDTKKLIDSCCKLAKVNYFADGYNLDDLGLSNKSASQVNLYI
jgi:opine dehydrogenase